jgi:triosephosphate isomerase
MRKPVIAGNWKMYKLINEAVDDALALRKNLANITGVEVILAPPFTAIAALAQKLEASNIKLAAQDAAPQLEFGALTGEVSPKMLKDAGCEYAIIGHSERRLYFCETNDSVNKKIKACLQAGLVSIACVGETLKEREKGIEKAIVTEQVRGALSGLTLSDSKRIIIAYEPVWAIGTGRTATPEIANEMHSVIRSVLSEIFDAETADEIRILYGGSVKSDNIKALMEMPDIDGALVGGASLKADEFTKIVNYRLL